MAVGRLGEGQRIYYNYVLWYRESEGSLLACIIAKNDWFKFDLIIHDLFLGGKDDCFGEAQEDRGMRPKIETTLCLSFSWP